MSAEIGSQTLTLTGEEAQVVRAALADALAGLREEIYKTEAYDLRGQLKQREAILNAVVARLPAA
jgi:hypothetical protein